MYNEIMIKPHIESFAKYAGVATVGIEWFALLFYYLKAPAYFNGKYMVSYFATLDKTRLVFSICYTLATFFLDIRKVSFKQTLSDSHENIYFVSFHFYRFSMASLYSQ